MFHDSAPVSLLKRKRNSSRMAGIVEKMRQTYGLKVDLAFSISPRRNLAGPAVFAVVESQFQRARRCHSGNHDGLPALTRPLPQCATLRSSEQVKNTHFGLWRMSRYRANPPAPVERTRSFRGPDKRNRRTEIENLV